uniref:response regulator n=1 Tax=Paenibacillus sonchi TaxID=373687 RepID=UPI00398A89C4
MTLPGLNGIELCRRLRQEKQTPVIMITARYGLSIKSTDWTAERMITSAKPFAIEELLARMRSLLRRTGSCVRGNCWYVRIFSWIPWARRLPKAEKRLI